MRLSSYQPQYFPRLHYFARALDSDIFTVSDYLQFVKAHSYPTDDGGHKRGKSYQADTPIKLANGVHHLTVPVRHAGLTPINETRISYDTPWPRKHCKNMEAGYARAPHFSSLLPHLTEIWETRQASLAHLNIMTILLALLWILGERAITPRDATLETVNAVLTRPHPFRLQRVVRLSETDILPPGATRDATDWIMEVCQSFGCNEYLFGGTGGTAYMDFKKFRRAGITTVQQEWRATPYPQQYQRAGFIPNLSIVDLLANADPRRVAEVLNT